MAEFRMPTQQEIIRDGKELGYVGTELQVYVKEMLKEAKEQQVKAEAKEQQVKAEAKEQQDRERDERIAVLNAKKEAEQAEQAKIEAVHAAEQGKREAELQKVTLEETTKAVAIRAAAEEKEKEREFQLGLARLAADEKAREQELQKEIKAREQNSQTEIKAREQELQKEIKAREQDIQLDLARLEASEKAKDRELERYRLDVERIRADRGAPTNDANGEEEQNTTRRGFARGPKMTPWTEKEDMDGFIVRFEAIAEMQGWERRRWATYLSGVLSGKALEVITRMPSTEATDYDVVKEALLRRFNQTEEGYKQKFFSSKAEGDESPQQYIARLSHYLTRWVKLAGIEMSYKGLRDLVVREQFLGMCTKELEIFLREGSVKDLGEISKRAEHYIDAHKTRGMGWTRTMMRVDARRTELKDTRGPMPEAGRNSGHKEMRRCLNCGIIGHIMKDCRKLRRDGAGAMEFEEYEDDYGEEMGALESQDWRVKRGTMNQNRGQFSRGYGSEPRPRPTYGRGQDNMYGRGVGYRPWQQPQQQTTTEIKQVEQTLFCKQHNRDRCTDCLNIPRTGAHTCALLSECVELKCGCTVPVVADACKVQRKGNMPVTEGKVNDKPVSVLRDTGCSTIVVKRDLVEESQLTGKETVCVLIDGTIRRTPLARIHIDTEYYKGDVEAVCMKNPLYELIVGNLKGIKEIDRDKENAASAELVETLVETNAESLPISESAASEPVTRETLAVVTRQMKQNESKVMKPLKVTAEIDGNTTREEVINLQKADNTLTSTWGKVDNNKVDEDLAAGEYRFTTKAELLYRILKTREGRIKCQLVLPKQMREKALRVAHEGIMSGHQGVMKTSDRLSRAFWFPGIGAEVARYCRSCDICQRTLAKGRVPKAELGVMPIIDTPFDRVAVDLIGPIEPMSERGHRYILTVVDFATRYPEAVALKNITTETVAEALVEIYSRVGIPKEVLSDQGSQFVSGMMKEVSRILSVKQLVTSPYHAMCNGLCEKFNGTLKAMLKKVCSEKPKDWDRYIAAILFAYRGVRQESLGFAPFELLYGRTVRGPVDILKELWTKEEVEPEVKTTYEYVVDLQNRLKETCELAQIELRKAQEKQRAYYNRNAVKREFKVGSKVLILRPTNNNKLLMQWQGPFTVIERVRGNDYQIDLNGKSRMYHTNMLKQYYERGVEENEETYVEPEIEEEMDYETTGAAILEPEEREDIELPLLEPGQKETYKDVDVNPELDEIKKMEVWKLLQEYQDVFSDKPNLTNLGMHEIKLNNTEPIKAKPYPIPHTMRNILSNEIDSMLKLKVIETSTSAYASPVVMVKKPDNSVRVCCDYRKLNKVTVFDPEPMATADEIFALLYGCHYFSKFDLAKGYWQVPMKEEDKDLTTFTTHRGLFRFNVMPFGLINAPATFSRIMRKLLDGTERLHNYLDDVLASTDSWQLHLTVLRELFNRARAGCLAIRPSKCSVGYNTVKFLGYNVSSQGLSPARETVDKLLRAPRPETKTQLRSFMGLVGFYRRFVPSFAQVAVALTDLTRKGAPNKLCWEAPQEHAFVSLRNYIASEPILRLPDYTKQFILQTDASAQGLGAILLQEEEGLRHPIAFASRKLLPREQNYATIERECLAVVWGTLKFQKFLYGQHYLLEVDHEPLKYLTQSSYQNGRLMRWALALQPYRFTVRYIKGSQNVGADFLSRHSVDDK